MAAQEYRVQSVGTGLTRGPLFGFLLKQTGKSPPLIYMRFDVYNRLTWTAVICRTLIFFSSENEFKFLSKSSNDQPFWYLTFHLLETFLSLNTGFLIHIYTHRFLLHIGF